MARIDTLGRVGTGSREIVVIANPAAGVELSATVPAGELWLVHSMLFTLVASAAAANRRVQVQIDDGSAVFYKMPGPADQIASETRRYMCAAHGLSAEVGPATVADKQQLITLPLQPIILLPAWRIYTNTIALQAGDDFGAATLLVEKWRR